MKKSTREAAPKTGGKKKQNKVLYYVILVILLGILVAMLLLGALKLFVGIALATINPIIGALYTFFF